jgi:hypothetical protein
MTRQNLQHALGLKAEKNFRMVHLRPALRAGLIRMSIPTKPNRCFQKYRLTAKGKAYLAAPPPPDLSPNMGATLSIRSGGCEYLGQPGTGQRQYLLGDLERGPVSILYRFDRLILVLVFHSKSGGLADTIAAIYER